MYYVYVLKSHARKYFYTGCSRDLKSRLQEHNNGRVTSSKPYAPFDIIYYEACLNKTDAFKREKYLKTRLGKSYLRKRLHEWLSTIA